MFYLLANYVSVVEAIDFVVSSLCLPGRVRLAYHFTEDVDLRLELVDSLFAVAAP